MAIGRTEVVAEEVVTVIGPEKQPVEQVETVEAVVRRVKPTARPPERSIEDHRREQQPTVVQRVIPVAVYVDVSKRGVTILRRVPDIPGLSG
jgi:hypothetical protein